MKSKIKLGVYSAVLLSGLACGTLGTNDLVAQASSNEQQVVSHFADVKADHWAYESIQWAQSKGIVSGYGDGRFGPNDAVTESQFVTMVANYLGLEADYGQIDNSKKGGPHWSDDRYNAIAKYGVPLNGYFDNSIRNQPMKRGLVAQVLTHLVGYETDLRGSIEFLLDNNITVGQNPQFKESDLYKFFGTTNTLSRSQIVVFLHRLETEELNNLSKTIEQPSGKSIEDIAAVGKSRVDISLSEGTTPKTNGESRFTPNTNNNGGGTVLKPPSETKPVANKVSGRFINNIKEGLTTYTQMDDEFTIRDTSKKGIEGSVFSYSDNVEKKMKTKPGDTLYFTEHVSVGTDFYKSSESNKKYIASLVIDAGFELTEDEIIQNVDKAIGNGESIVYKKYKFIEELSGNVSIKKLY